MTIERTGFDPACLECGLCGRHKKGCSYLRIGDMMELPITENGNENIIRGPVREVRNGKAKP